MDATVSCQLKRASVQTRDTPIHVCSDHDSWIMIHRVTPELGLSRGRIAAPTVSQMWHNDDIEPGCTSQVHKQRRWYLDSTFVATHSLQSSVATHSLPPRAHFLGDPWPNVASFTDDKSHGVQTPCRSINTRAYALHFVSHRLLFFCVRWGTRCAAAPSWHLEFGTMLDIVDCSLPSTWSLKSSISVVTLMDMTTVPKSSAAGVLYFDHAQWHAFRPTYQRNNKKGGHKNLRCFPTCCNGVHATSGFCGSAVTVRFQWLDLSVTAPHVHIVAQFSPLTDSGVPDWTTFTTLPSPDDNAWYIADAVSLEPSSSSSSEMVATLNTQLRGWHYGWVANRHTSETLHVLCVYALLETDDEDAPGVRCLHQIHTPPFRIFSRRRANSIHLRRRASAMKPARHAPLRPAVARHRAASADDLKTDASVDGPAIGDDDDDDDDDLFDHLLADDDDDDIGDETKAELAPHIGFSN
ncbi:Aste57867_11936 [Aphanomyces stellatus]|uniref:Aste57867_11936 protein n=1 Tax=Aphanomyces stellatus TaxID=120398 RepID=A0A485KUC3_9STRA|nr:hypothetical protein As57867_011891 [Aphanomyces stellatus]VFT88791.1 Aste57867_11936 [Aphanomyces stellatus]